MYIRDGQPSVVIGSMPVGTGGVTKGDLVVVSANTVVKAAAAPTAATVLGIALKTVAATGYVDVELVADRIITAKYVTGSKTSVVDADKTKVFDLTDAQSINLDDTTGGCCFCVGYDNVAKTMDFLVTEAAKIV